MKKKKQIPVKVDKAEVQIKDFFDMIAPSAVKFFADYFIFGDTYRCVWAIREYPPMTTDQAILSRFGDKENVTLHIYSRYVDNAEQHKILQNAQRKNTMLSTSTDLQESINAEGNIEDVVTLLNEMRRTKEPLLHCAVFIELSAYGLEKLKELQTEVSMELTREKISVDRLTLRQKEGFMAISPTGYNALDKQFERVLPASSVANLYPFNYSGKTDANGFYIGKDRYGTNILVDFDKREDDKTNSNILILGNSGQGKHDYKNVVLNGEWNEEPPQNTTNKKTCPICGYPMQFRYKNAYGLRLFMCTNEPEVCGFMTNEYKAGKLCIMKCDQCRDGYLIVKPAKNVGYFLGCTNYKADKTGCSNIIWKQQYYDMHPYFEADTIVHEATESEFKKWHTERTKYWQLRKDISGSSGNESERNHRRKMPLISNVISLDTKIDCDDDDESISLHDIVADPDSMFEDELITRVMVRNAISKLTADEQEFIFTLFYDPQGIPTERELESKYGVTHQALNYRKQKIFEKLRNFICQNP